MSAILWPLVDNQIRRGEIWNTYGHFPQRTKGVHWGWDFYAKCGTPCYAIADGVIASVYGSTTDKENFGLVVVLKFSFGKKHLYAAYCHLSGSVVRTGQKVSAGDQVGFTGNSGNAYNMTGPDEHLHFEIRTSVRPVPGGAPLRISPLLIYKICPLHHRIVEI